MGMYDDITTGVSENIQIGGHPFYAENIDSNEPFNRREYTFKPILNGTLSVKRGKYVQRKFSFQTTLYHGDGRADAHDSILAELCSKPQEIVSQSMGGTFKGIVTFSKSIDDGSPYHTNYDVDIIEVPDKTSNIPGENSIVVPTVKKAEDKKTTKVDAKLNKTYNDKLKKCKVPYRKNQKNNCVKVLQDKLILIGLLNKKHKSGVYDSNTITAVTNFQKSTNKLKVTGIVNKYTLSYLIKADTIVSTKKNDKTKNSNSKSNGSGFTKGNLSKVSANNSDANKLMKKLGMK